MNAGPHQEPAAIRPLQVVLISLVTAAVAGSSWLLSAPESTTLVDGAVEWNQESPLRAVVQLLCLNYGWPTLHAGTVKMYILGMGSGLAMLALSIAIAMGPRSVAEEGGFAADESAEAQRIPATRQKRHVAPLLAAQVMVGLYLLWSFASSRVSAAPELAIGGSVLLTIHFLWSFAIGNGLNPRAARMACGLLVAVTAVTAALAIWYYYGRNPTLRAKFPFGNPNFLSACLIPGIVLAVAFACAAIQGASGGEKRARSLAAGLTCVAVIAVASWAFFLTKSRGPALGLGAGLLALAFFAVRRWKKWIPVAVAAGAMTLASAYFLSIRDEPSATGRTATLRFRLYAWSYAWRMFLEKPLTGHGQGGFVLAGDGFAAADVEGDPEVLGSLIGHAHNEWLEVMADLGSVGVVLLGVALALTLHAGAAALRAPLPSGRRWPLIGLLAGLVGMLVESSFGVGLRVAGVPTFFYTVIGLIWAMAAPAAASALPHLLSATSTRRGLTGMMGCGLGLAALALTQQDFDAARAAFQARALVRAGEFEEAIKAAAARSRLNPQHALANLYRLSEAHMLAAKALEERAADRERRSREGDILDVRLLELATEDRSWSDAHCQEGSAALKALITKSPGALNHGWVLYWLNRIHAANADARGQPDLRDQFLQDAAAALARELERQPFDQEMTLEYLRAPGHTIAPERALDLLARPLRLGRITSDYVDYLAELSVDPMYELQFEPALQAAREALGSSATPPQVPALLQSWTPEKLRLAATIRFRRGDYDRAARTLESAVALYDRSPGAPRIALASCLAELADSQFFSRPNEPEKALVRAERSMEAAPASLMGRRLLASVRQRRIDYLLAAEREEEAVVLLRETAPGHVTEEAVQVELGARYRRLCESLLRRRLALELRQSPDELLGKLDLWIGRALALDPQNGAAHYLAADLAFHRGACDEAAGQLRRAIQLDLPPDIATQFLAVALDRAPDCEALSALWAELTQDGQPEAIGPPAPDDPPSEAP